MAHAVRPESPATRSKPMSSNVEALYASHHGWLVQWLGYKLGGADHALDLAQDTFLRILSVQDSGRELILREPRAYLRTVAQRLLINHWQRCSLEQAYLDALALLPEPEAPSPEHRLIILETLHEVDAMLDGLPAPARQAFLMSQLDGLTYAEIAAHLKVTQRTIKRYMAAAFEQCILLVS